MNDIERLRGLIDRYWVIAYAEGKENRDHDTACGDAQRCRDDIERVLGRMQDTPSPTREQVTEASRLVPEYALDWLFGEGPDKNGQWFGEVRGSGAFWWRSQFRAMIDASPTGGEAGAVAWSLIFREEYGVNAETTFKTEGQAQVYASKCSRPPRVVPLYTHPSPLMDEVEAALEPFARYAEIYDESYPTRHPEDIQIAATISGPMATRDAYDINLGHLRAARALLTKIQEGGR